MMRNVRDAHTYILLCVFVLAACGTLVPPPGIELGHPLPPRTASVPSPNHWTARGFPQHSPLEADSVSCGSEGDRKAREGELTSCFACHPVGITLQGPQGP